MNASRIAGITLALGAAVGVALTISSVAYGDPPSATDFNLPGSPGSPTDVDYQGALYPWYATLTQQTPWTIYDQSTGDVLGNYVTSVDQLDVLGFRTFSSQVIDSTGAAPAVGALWDTANLGIPLALGGPLGGAELPLAQNLFYSDPSGSMRDLFQIFFFSTSLIANYFSTGPDGTLDELIFGGTIVVPLFDFPAPAAAELAALF